MTTTPHPSSSELAAALGTIPPTRVAAPPMTAEVKERLVKKQHAIPDAFALYMEGIVWQTHPVKGAALAKHVKAFLAENMVVTQVRDRGHRAARWTHRVYSDHDEARAKLADWFRSIKETAEGVGGGFEMRGTPQLVQMTRADVAELREGRMPVARFSGYNEIVHTEGKLDDETWQPKVTK